MSGQKIDKAGFEQKQGNFLHKIGIRPRGTSPDFQIVLKSAKKLLDARLDLQQKVNKEKRAKPPFGCLIKNIHNLPES